MNQVILGFGEIGKAVLAAIVEEAVIIEINTDLTGADRNIDIMHVCFPYSHGFEAEVKRYMGYFNPKHVIIYSTLPIGTTLAIDDKIVHSPVEGKHPDLELSIRTMERWIGYNDENEGKFFNGYFKELGFKTKMVSQTNFTEALKLLSTTEYGLNIEFARYKQLVADQLNMPFELTKEWNKEYNRLYQNLGMGSRFQKFVLDAPKGPKGGHCVVPNARLLDKQFPNDLVKIVGELL